jgi:PleD family two-component response regulator
MNTEIVVALIEAAPSVVTILLVLVLALVFRDAIQKRLLPRLSGLKLLGVEITLLKDSLDAAASRQEVRLSEADKWSALQRAQHIFPVLRGARLLWVDDQPMGNEDLVAVLLRLGIVVDQARHTEEAIKLLHRHPYDLVISDMQREGVEDAGLQMISRMLDEHVYRWTILYVLRLQPGVPANSFGITNRPDHLLHLVMDALERERWHLVVAPSA